MAEIVEISVARDFTTAPGARFRSHGEYSGEEFRQRFLEPLFLDPEDNRSIRINLDGVAGFAPSFLDEAFGGLARQFGSDRVALRLRFVSTEDVDLVKEISRRIQSCENQKR